MLDPQEIEAIQTLSKEHDGRCPECHGIIKFYRYAVSKSAVQFLRAMAGWGNEKQSRTIDVSQLGLTYSTRTQITKMRLHGLIVQQRDEDDHHVPNMWIITRKGWAFLRGMPIPMHVIVYNNQVTGHSDVTATVGSIMDDKLRHEPFWSENATTGEARAFNDIREPKKSLKLQAVRQTPGKYTPQQESVEIVIEHLEVGKPIKMLSPIEYEYRDINAFRRAWRVV